MKKTLFRNTTLLLLVALVVISCGNNTKKLKTKNQQIEQVRLTSYDESFLEFWEIFQNAVLNNDLSKLETTTYFPFEDFYNNVYNPNFTLTCKNMDEFKNKFDLIFDECVIEAIKGNKYRAYDKNYSQFGDVIDKKDFLLITNCLDREKDLLFKKIENKYLSL